MQLCNGGNLRQLISDAYSTNINRVRPIGFTQEALRGIMFQITEAFCLLLSKNYL